ncbi:MAG: phosphoribosylglycinamide formyltransferase [Candidatus Omnitrophota bacterium]|nr:phosphoribosylglycinamide formyltransferase [Candidatus Omnitrophota bacterium]
MENIAVFASGKGTNFTAIAKAVKSGLVKANLSLLVCDQPKALVLKRAKKEGIKSIVIQRGGFKKRPDFENKIVAALKKEKIGLIVLAGFMRILSPAFIKLYRGKILNIHPSLLPSFKGSNAIKDAFNYGAKLTGVTVHFIDELVDHGPIILQKEVLIKNNDTLPMLEKRIHNLEHKLYPQAIRLFLKGGLKIKSRRVLIN